ncbi:MAG: SUMF1/EgtB/PvdO family nonheme iron enzyme, partial [Terriglobia bacterium]
MLATQMKATLQLELLARLSEARSRTDELFDLVTPDSFYERPIPERHRIVFYLGHVEAFDWNLLHQRVLNRRSFHPGFDRLFAFGIDPVEGELPSDHPVDWPSIAEIRNYNSRVRRFLDSGLQKALLSRSESGNGATPDDFPASILLNVAIEHRLMHAETLAYILHQLPLNRKLHRPLKPPAEGGPKRPEMVEIPEGSAVCGLSRDDSDVFGWDNEYEEQTASVPSFSIDRTKVTNGQYLEFIRAGGYDDRALWSADAWKWKTEHGISHPAFWKRAGDRWHYRAMFADLPLPLDWPVYVSHAEAAAYAHWAGKSLPSEAQWHRAAYGAPHG